MGGRNGGRKPFEPNDKMRGLVQALAGFGTPQAEIALQVINPKTNEPIDSKTLRQYFRVELDNGEAVANSAVKGALYKSAVEKGNVTAQIFWLKTRCNWRETERIELTGKNGGPVETKDVSDEKRATALATFISKMRAKKPSA